MKERQKRLMGSTIVTVAVIVLLLVLWGLIPKTITKRLPVTAGQELQVLLFELAEGHPLMIDHGKILKKDLPKGVDISGGSIDGISKENGELKVTLTWNNKQKTYETRIAFVPRK